MKAKKITNINFRITEDNKRNLQSKADAEGRTLSNYIQKKLTDDSQ